MSDAIAYPRHHIPAGEDFLLLSPTAQAYAYRNVDRMFAHIEFLDRDGEQPRSPWTEHIGLQRVSNKEDLLRRQLQRRAGLAQRFNVSTLRPRIATAAQTSGNACLLRKHCAENSIIHLLKDLI